MINHDTVCDLHQYLKQLFYVHKKMRYLLWPPQMIEICIMAPGLNVGRHTVGTDLCFCQWVPTFHNQMSFFFNWKPASANTLPTKYKHVFIHFLEQMISGLNY